MFVDCEFVARLFGQLNIKNLITQLKAYLNSYINQTYSSDTSEIRQKGSFINICQVGLSCVVKGYMRCICIKKNFVKNSKFTTKAKSIFFPFFFCYTYKLMDLVIGYRDIKF